MLVLSRKCQQSIIIGDDIEVSVLEISAEKVRIGITAPRSIPVFRTEIYVDRQSLAQAGAGVSEGEPGQIAPRSRGARPRRLG